MGEGYRVQLDSSFLPNVDNIILVMLSFFCPVSIVFIAFMLVVYLDFPVVFHLVVTLMEWEKQRFWRTDMEYWWSLCNL